jgi:hypothetical protein
MNARNRSLHPSTTPGAEATLTPTGQGMLRLPSGPPHRYRLSQLDDYHTLARHHFPWRPPLTFKIRARASHTTLPGTWGFGLWNDPLSLSLGFGSGRKLPALPNTAWFFFASSENYLSLRDDLPGNGALAGTFRAPNLPVLLLAPGTLAVPLLFLTPAARLLRRIVAQIVRQDAVALPLDPTEWHEYTFNWISDHVTFRVDGQVVFETPVSPRGPLGLVIWVDNQFAAWRPDGGLKWGLLEGKVGWFEFEALKIL